MEFEFECTLLDRLRLASFFATKIDRSGGYIFATSGERAGHFAGDARLFPNAQDGTIPVRVLTKGGYQDAGT